ncbi:MAG: hypothetical protein KBA02_07995 [Paludibacteraceae bacterium]|nr:hypothetical protein [Paludibacteraceae bacterium]
MKEGEYVKQFVCENCGAHDFTLNNGYIVCQFCNTKYVITDDDIPKKESVISVREDVKRLLEKCKNDPLNARRYANLVLDIDPTNREAHKYI